MRAAAVLAALATVALTACGGEGGGGRGASPAAVGIRVVLTGGEPVEEQPAAMQFQVVDTAGEVVLSWSGAVLLSASFGGLAPSSVEIVDGIADAQVVFEAASDNWLVMRPEGLPVASVYVSPLPAIPERIGGSGTGGSVLDAGPGWDAGGVWGPSVAVESGTTLLWYSGAALGSTSGNIGLAQSSDGLSFTKQGSVLGPAVTAHACHVDGAEAPSVVEGADGVGYLAFYAGTNAGRRHLCRATSQDGIAWTVTDGAEEDLSVLAADPRADRFDNGMVTGAAVFRLWDGSLAALYSGSGSAEIYLENAAAETIYGIGLARSTDEGLTWARDEDAWAAGGIAGALFSGFLESPGGDAWDGYGQYGAGVAVDGDLVRLWISGLSEGGRRIGYRLTGDVEYWNAHVDNFEATYHEILGPGATGAFDASGVEYPALAESGGVRRMYYTGRDGIGTRRIGVAAFP